MSELKKLNGLSGVSMTNLHRRLKTQLNDLLLQTFITLFIITTVVIMIHSQMIKYVILLSVIPFSFLPWFSKRCMGNDKNVIYASTLSTQASCWWVSVCQFNRKCNKRTCQKQVITSFFVTYTLTYTHMRENVFPIHQIAYSFEFDIIMQQSHFMHPSSSLHSRFSHTL